MSLRPILYHIFPKPLPYLPALALQERIHSIQARSRNPDKPASQDILHSSTHPDVLLLLEHRPVYTAGRRQDAQELDDERRRLEKSGADWVATQRGGETTYHGPGQIVGYPLFDLIRMGIRTRDHVCKTQTLLKTFLQQRHRIPAYESSHTGVFFSDTEKLASIGMQVRHGLTSHGFAVNITNEPIAWFDQVVACGLAEVKAASVQSVKEKLGEKLTHQLDLLQERDVLARMYGETYGTSVKPLSPEQGEIWEAVKEVEEIADKAGDWPITPYEV
ncbi:hypothetical protein FRC17_007427 [Serendipita sp. 399]|nr:hypothetical protein FRC17_007427 [Serendipita sp. 399]